MCPSLGLKLKAVQIFRELQVCFLGGLLAALMLEEGGVSFRVAALVTLLAGAVGHWYGTTGAVVNKPGIACILRSK